MRNGLRVVALTALVASVASPVLTASVVANANDADEPSIEFGESTDFGKFRGVSFSAHECRFTGTADDLPYTRADFTSGPAAFDVGCLVILPTNLSKWNGRVAVEPLDAFTTGVPLEFAGYFRQVLLTDEAFFAPRDGGRWGYAIVSYFGANAGDTIDQPPADTTLGVYPAASIEILTEFAHVLGGDGGDLFGMDADSVIGMGLSNQGTALRGVLAASATLSPPLDASLISATNGTLVVDPTNTVALSSTAAQDFGLQRALFLNTETEVAPNGTADVFGLFPVAPVDLTSEIDDVNRFRYELAGASHLDPFNQADLETAGLVPPGTFDDSNPLRWTAVLRGLFERIDEWLVKVSPPPPSRLIERAAVPGLSDPAYPGHPSVVTAIVERDADLNAVGGVRLPNVELGVGTYRAVGPPLDFSDDSLVEFFQWLAGGFDDLSCIPRSDGSPRFAGHDDYVGSYRAVTMALAADGFIEQTDASSMIKAAAQSDIGKCP